MTLSIWRYAHLLLAILTSLVLIVASLTGIVLAVDVANEKTLPYKVDNFDKITIAEILPAIYEKYPEILSLSVDSNEFVAIEAFDADGNDVKGYINPRTGEIVGKLIQKSQFTQWNLALHRSLFLHQTGRFIVGVASFLFFLIAVSGTVLLIKRQNGILRFFSKITADSVSQYVHVLSGRIMLLPIVILALSGTYLFLVRFDIIPKQTVIASEFVENTSLPKKNFGDFPIFRDTKLKDVTKIDFPFIVDDPEEYFILKTDGNEFTIHQVSGQIVGENQYPVTKIVEDLAFDWHTGQNHILWAIILALAGANILVFIYSGFAITVARTNTKVRNKHAAGDCEYILLVGSENGSTLRYANQIHRQLQANGKKSYLTEMNKYTTFENAKQLVIFTSTYGLGEAPASATKFRKLVSKYEQYQNIGFSVVGFGSKSYADFCEYAIQVDALLWEQSWAKQTLSLYTINDKSVDEFTNWIGAWANANSVAVSTAPSLYCQTLPELTKFKLIDRAEIETDGVITFRLVFKSVGNKYKSGDLLAIYPDQNHLERLYSIGKVNNELQLIVRLHPGGKGSEYLYGLKVGSVTSARLIRNNNFHFPKNASKVALISNGTGIAPFLGMIDENKRKVETHLYCGFRHQNELTNSYIQMAEKQISVGKLSEVHLALSRQEPAQYVMDLIQRDADFFFDLLENQGVIMICGSIKMQKDVENVLNSICEAHYRNFQSYKANGQILADCY